MKEVNLTPLRRRVFEIVWRQHEPIGAYEILAELARDREKAAPPTVYRALEFLQEAGLVHRPDTLNALLGCDRPEDVHSGQFLVCNQCRRVALNAMMDELANCEMTRDRDSFSRARRHFYRASLDICGNRELDRLFSAIHMQIVYAQYQSPYLQDIRFTDYRTICEAVIAGDVKTAEAAGARHVKRVRKVVLELAASLR